VKNLKNLFIPIKEESQRVPRKNFRVLPSGLPLWSHTVEKFSNFKIFIDTDSDEILEGCLNYEHVHAYKRDNSLIGHDVSVCDLIEYCIKTNNLKGCLAQIHVTSPFLKTETLSNAFSYLKQFDSIVSCNKVQIRLWRKEGYGYCPINHNPLKLEQTQDLPEYYEENSAFYIFDCESFLKNKSRVEINPYFYIIDYPENFDIDTESDWDLLQNLRE
jgi:CMP-N,N'-diacetyllegionaminic acid synthase